MSQSDACGCHPDNERARHDSAYRRALWIVILLNVGFGVVEVLAGFLARSQALKADALDFLGDGSITFVGLLALRWTAARRARVAWTQGWFLAVLGLGVLGTALWRTLHAVAPEAGIMGGTGAAALAVNVAAALVLLRFRERSGSGARAIWLFSRNDALANVGVIIAAGFVAWLESGWPDLLAAAIIATLFLHSARSIIQEARTELRTSRLAEVS